MNKHEKMYQEIEKHGANLNAIFKTKLDNITLSKKLFRLEAKAHQLATDYCNGEYEVDTDNFEALSNVILDKVNKLLDYKSKNIPIFLNGDARGYSLKIRDKYVREHNLQIYKDWGGYGILAPDFNN